MKLNGWGDAARRHAPPPPYHRTVVVIFATLLVLAGAQLAGFYASTVVELAQPPNTSSGFTLSLSLGEASLIANAVIIGMFVGHLALLGLAATGLMPQAGANSTGAWLAGIAGVGLACAGMLAAALSREWEINDPEAARFTLALAAYVTAGAALIALRFVGRKRRRSALSQ